MSSLGFQTIYNLLNSYSNIVCERVFQKGNGKSIESGRPLDDFAFLAFSISNELDYFNAVEILASSSIPLQSTERGPSHPIIISGGPCITANPEPLAPFFDVFAIGEGEVVLPPLIKAITEMAGESRDALLKAISKINGMYVPQFHSGEPVTRQWSRNIDDFATTSAILTPNTEFSNMYLIEIARGCPWGCRFCLAGYLFRPFRFRSAANLLNQCKQGLELTHKVGLLGACVSDHPQIDEVVSQLRKMGAGISVSSLRVKPISDAVLKALKESGTENLTMAPEAGSERLRRAINKGIDREDIMSAASKIIDTGFRQLKLYFMIGLPTETEDDIEEIIELAFEIKKLTERRRSGCHIILTIEPFVPKAGTPFQWLPMTGQKILNKRLSYLKRQLERKGIEVRSESVSWAVVQGVLSRGDGRLAPVLTKVAKDRTLSTWRQALAEYALDADYYTRREIPLKERLPWSYIDSGIKNDYLETELDRAGCDKPTPPCPIATECHRCGVC
ncbi:MAG: radical SAM protein [Dehalococcoidia bacterium]